MVSFKPVEKTSSMCNVKCERAHLKYIFRVLL